MFPVNGDWAKERLEIYNLVLKMQSAAYEMMKPGVEWEDIHLQAHKVLIQGFLELGIFNSKYSAEELFAAKASARFFPTGWATFLVWIRTMWVAAPTTPTLTRYCATCELDENWNQIWSSPTSQGVTSPLLIRRVLNNPAKPSSSTGTYWTSTGTLAVCVSKTTF